ncbi:hypothetical protein [Wohlfahrtiimonas populi]|uniref:hypothetical protein n=1 Tax=Wohlfahrtiimonas populi TaxID=1940240 RepID=UPI00117F3680|nr:hypothetical protein [Wohlfahrtiimonas populi]
MFGRELSTAEKLLLEGVTMLPLVGERDAFEILINGKSLTGDDTNRLWGLLSVLTLGVGQKFRVVDKAKDAVYEVTVTGKAAAGHGGSYITTHNRKVIQTVIDGNPIIFKVNDGQLGKKLGKHVSDFGLDPSNAKDREIVMNIIKNIGKEPERVIKGTFQGQGPNNTRGNVLFMIKGKDVVVTKPNGEVVTILENGINNSSVKAALKGNN